VKRGNEVVCSGRKKELIDGGASKHFIFCQTGHTLTQAPKIQEIRNLCSAEIGLSRLFTEPIADNHTITQNKHTLSSFLPFFLSFFLFFLFLVGLFLF